MTRTLGAVAVAVALTGGTVFGQAPDPKLVDQGKKLYATYKCDKCHMIGGKGSKKGPLDGVGAKLSPTEIRQWLTHPAEMEAKLEKPPKGTDSMANALKTKNIEPAEVDALVAYLRTLTKK
ncbi:MAG: cytochrome c [Acidobacteria bacterium]|nr:cytochrome c [Acidobacteriota bacterium]